jgi:hypothetical protein
MVKKPQVFSLPLTSFPPHLYRTQYIGNEAKPQLVKNGANTIVGFRNLLGKK